MAPVPKDLLALFPELTTMTPAERRAFFRSPAYRARAYPAPIAPDELADLPDPTLWELTRAHRITRARWRKGETPIPFPVRQLARLALYGDIPAGVAFAPGVRLSVRGIEVEGLRGAIPPRELRPMWIYRQAMEDLPRLEREIERLAAENAALREIARDRGRTGFMRGLVDVLQEQRA